MRDGRLFACWVGAWLGLSCGNASGPGALGSVAATAGNGVAGSHDAGGSAGADLGGSGGAGVGAEAGASGAPSGADGGSLREAFACPVAEVYGDPLAHQPIATNVHDGAVGFLEGPVWVTSRATLYYMNFEGSGSNGRIRSYQPEGGVQDIWLEGVGANGLAIDAQGLLVAAYHQEQRVARIDPDTQQILPVAGGDQYQGLPFNSVNDVVVRPDGHLYFTDPTYQRGDRPGQPFAGSYHLTPDGVITLIDTQEAPNGIALSPDGHALYVTGTGNPHPLMKYEVADDGAVTVPGTPISDLASDGVAVDCNGNLYLTTGGGLNGVITVLSPEGQVLGSIAVEATSGTTNAAFGGSDHKTLYVTTNSGGLFQVPMVVPGLP